MGIETGTIVINVSLIMILDNVYVPRYYTMLHLRSYSRQSFVVTPGKLDNRQT